MKKIYLSILALAIGSVTYAQTYSDDFESYTEGDYIGVESDTWTTWSGTTGGAEDAQINTDQANSGSNSIYFEVSGSAGPQDVVLDFGGLHTDGLFDFEAMFYIPDGNAAYFNFQGASTIGETWAIDVYMNDDGTLAVSASGTNHVNTTYPVGQWFKVEFSINLTLNIWEFLLDDVSEGTWTNGVNQVSMADFYPATSNDLWYMDDVSYTVAEYVIPDVNATVQNVSIGAIGVAGQQKIATVTVGNGGLEEITSFDLAVTYNGEEINISESGLSLASLDNMEVDLTSTITLIAGENDMIATVSNVNGAGQDDDASDDSSVKNIDPAVPAAHRVVIAEEGTGTWCGWCPRGAVAMDFMAENYDGYYFGIAVHNGDPMVVSEYDDAIGFSSYPSARVDRVSIIDPSGIELDFVSRVEETAAAIITTGAEMDGNNLLVSITYDFIESAPSDWTVLCVLTEDGVSGTSTDYAQSNYYSGGGSGPMGGYEDLANPVPASQMVYDHVARAISPDYNGVSDAFQFWIGSGQSHTFNFTFPISSDWDINNMHIIGMLIESDGTINNGGGSTVNDALDLGWVDGIDELDHIVAEFEVYPNPANNNVNIKVDLKVNSEISLQLIDLSGKTVRTIDYGMLNGFYVLPVDINGLTSGLYMLNFYVDGQMITQKLVVE